MNTTIRQLLDTADLLIDGNGGPTTAGAVPGGPAITGAGRAVPAPPTTPLTATALTATAASRCRGAAFALRAALLWLRSCSEAGTARRAKATWSQLCLGCHYHQYEIGPTEDQVRAWRSEVAVVVALLAP